MGTYGGEVTDPKMFTKNFSYTKDGLLSESIFGPERDFCCTCGKLSSRAEDGKCCDKCGVMCISKDSRLTTFGKITLAFPVIKTTKKKFFKKIVGTQHKHLLDPRKADALAVTSQYLAISSDGKKLKVVSSLTTQNNYYILPIRITGLYSFILSLKYVANYLKLEVAQDLFDKKYIMDIIKVLPPEVRPVVRDPKKPDAIRITEVNKPYTSLIHLNRSNANIKIVKEDQENEWLKTIHMNFKNQFESGIIEEIVDQMVQEYDRITARYQFYVDKVYSSIFESISGKYGFIRSSILGKTIEFSGRSVITINPSLPPYKIKVSKRILYKLWFPYFLNFLQKKHSEYNYIDLFDKFVQSSDYEENRVLFNEFLNDFIKQPETAKVIASTVVKMRKIERDDDE